MVFHIGSVTSLVTIKIHTHIICRATKLNWVNLANSIPSFKEDAIPNYKRHLFGSDTIVRAPEHTRTQAPPQPVSQRTRSNRVNPHDLPP